MPASTTSPKPRRRVPPAACAVLAGSPTQNRVAYEARDCLPTQGDK